MMNAKHVKAFHNRLHCSKKKVLQRDKNYYWYILQLWEKEKYNPTLLYLYAFLRLVKLLIDVLINVANVTSDIKRHQNFFYYTG